MSDKRYWYYTFKKTVRSVGNQAVEIQTGWRMSDRHPLEFNDLDNMTITFFAEIEAGLAADLQAKYSKETGDQ